MAPLQPYLASFYANSLTRYSWSKSLSLPGERIGYVAVNPTATDADLSRAHDGPDLARHWPQLPAELDSAGAAKVIDQTADLNVYETNMNLLLRCADRHRFRRGTPWRHVSTSSLRRWRTTPWRSA